MPPGPRPSSPGPGARRRPWMGPRHGGGGPEKVVARRGGRGRAAGDWWSSPRPPGRRGHPAVVLCRALVPVLPPRSSTGPGAGVAGGGQYWRCRSHRGHPGVTHWRYGSPQGMPGGWPPPKGRQRVYRGVGHAQGVRLGSRVRVRETQFRSGRATRASTPRSGVVPQVPPGDRGHHQRCIRQAPTP